MKKKKVVYTNIMLAYSKRGCLLIFVKYSGIGDYAYIFLLVLMLHLLLPSMTFFLQIQPIISVPVLYELLIL